MSNSILIWPNISNTIICIVCRYFWSILWQGIVIYKSTLYFWILRRICKAIPFPLIGSTRTTNIVTHSSMFFQSRVFLPFTCSHIFQAKSQITCPLLSLSCLLLSQSLHFHVHHLVVSIFKGLEAYALSPITLPLLLVVLHHRVSVPSPVIPL